MLTGTIVGSVIAIYMIWTATIAVSQDLRFGEDCETGLPDFDDDVDVGIVYMQANLSPPRYIWPSTYVEFLNITPASEVEKQITNVHAMRTIIAVDCDSIKKDFEEEESGLILNVLTDINSLTKCVTFKTWKTAFYLEGKLLGNSQRIKNPPYNAFHTGIKFIKNHTHDSSCSARYRGSRGDPLHATVFLGKNCFSYHTVLHEVMHGLGFQHEQQRHNRDRSIILLNDSIKATCQKNYVKSKTQWVTDVGPYGFGTVMHYAPKACAKANQYAWVMRDIMEIASKRGTVDQAGADSVKSYKEIKAKYSAKTVNHQDIYKINTVYSCNPAKLWTNDVCGHWVDESL